MTDPAPEAAAQAASAQAALADEFKTAFREHPAAVAIIAGQTATGPVGLTASSVSSVAVDPATLSFSVTRATGSAGGLLEAGDITVNLLSLDQETLALDFARSGAPRFTPEQGWEHFPTGEPYLPQARETLRCRIASTVKVGGSTIVLAEVLEVLHGSSTPPLMYQNRRFGRLDASSFDQ
ncbi:flavin reductase family protein [Pseudoclavibacter sp. RFBB5]|uniref:flavin reductase family protein n=1 Tax=Pseudoclavibacter sp. RFBB5 TaxID=2080574 RepID=UPI000CE8687D|nr:flavin reductase family protein [Pseudoclavibacter sp. RFBB5]PPG32772.1 flavin oxidoreductase [Pseudoclavibacter sp. RFBB5]